jgi:anti-sigma regulatory factor (Ser/Thr protein kinase)/CheY-like chemotaxis protein
MSDRRAGDKPAKAPTIVSMFTSGTLEDPVTHAGRERSIMLCTVRMPPYMPALRALLAPPCHIGLASTARRAHDMIAGEQPDLLLLDQSLPDMEHGSATTDLLELAHARNVPAFLVIDLDGGMDGDDHAGLKTVVTSFTREHGGMAFARVRHATDIARIHGRLAAESNLQGGGTTGTAEPALPIARSQGPGRVEQTDIEFICQTLSHELRAALHAVHGHANWLCQYEADQLSAGGQRVLAKVAAATQRMDGIIHDMLAYANADYPARPSKPLALNPLVEDVARQLERSYPWAQIDIGPLPSVTANPTAVRQIFSNLISNALKFSAKVVKPQVNITATVASGRMEISVADNGVGFDPGQADKLFQMHARLHPAEQYPGNGVGLAIARRLAERLGGTIRAESTPGVTTQFVLSLPCATEPAG